MKYIVVVIALFAGMIGWSQQLTFVFKGTVENQDLGKNESGVTVAVVQGGSSVLTTTTVSSGKYSLRGEINYKQPFDIVFSKGGLVSKKVHFDFSKMNEEDAPPGDIRPVDALDIALFKERENIDFSFLNTEPVASFDWNTRQMAISLDAVESANMRKKIDELLNKAEQDKALAEQKYNEAIKAADQFYNEKKYEDALGKYEEALGYKPTDKYAADKINELDALIQAQKKEELIKQQEDSEYNNLITAADNLRDQGKYENAIDKYEEALTKKDEQYPKDQIDAIEKKIKEAANQAKYDEAIKMADGFLKQNSLRAARDKYEEASKLKPSEQYPKDKLAEIEKKLKDQEDKEALKKKYDDAVAAADQLFTAEDYEGAKAKYEEALTYEPSSTYVKGRIDICNEKLAAAQAEKERLEKIAKLLEQGNAQIAKSEWEPAKASFTEVLSLEAGHPEATEKLALIDQKMKEAADEALQEQKFAQLVKEGDDANTAGKLEDALAKYQEAKAIKSTPEVEAKIADIQKKLNDQQALAEKEAQYNNHISEGESMMGIIGDIDGARAEFEKALALFPDRQLPKDKIAEIDKLLAAQESAKAYQDKIKQADDLFDGAKYEEARKMYEQAAALDAKKTYPAERIAEIDKKLADMAANKEREAKYEAAINSANTLFNQAKWEEAKEKYREAMTYDATKTYPSERIAEIEKLMANQQADAEKKAAYEAAVKEADHLFNEAKWEEAAAKYREALSFDSEQKHPKDRLTEIDGLVAKKAEQDAKAAQIADLLSQGNQLYQSKELENAKGKFQEVLTLDAANSEASTMIQKINTELAAMKNEAEKDALFDKLKQEGFDLAANKSYDKAKQKLQEALTLKSDQEVTDKLAEIDQLMKDDAAKKEIEERYNKLMSEASAKEVASDFTAAINKYREASAVKPDEQLPKDKIKELETLLSNASEQEKIDQEYRALMDKGDALMKEEKYLDAIKEYNNALALKPGEQEPVDKAAEAERLEKAKSDIDKQYEKILSVAQEKIDGEDYNRAIELLERAISLKERDERPKQMLETAKDLKKKSEEYKTLMTQGDALASSKDYSGAKTKYEQALNLKPTATEPPQKIAEMDRLLAELSSGAEKEALYKEYMDKGNVSMSTKNYQQALSHYQDALSVKPGDIPATNKIKEVQQILDDIANANAKDLERKNKFNALISAADGLFSAESYLEAKTKYEEALKVDPASSYAKTQIDECVRLERLKGKAEAEREYQKIITAGDRNFDSEDYEKAKDYYNRALGIKRDDPYPKKRLEEIEAILNPVMVNSGELDDPGVRFDGSMEEALNLLQKAEEERKAQKTNRIVGTQNDIRDKESDMTSVKTRDHYDNSERIYQHYQTITQDATEAGLDHQENIAILRAAEKELSDAQREDESFEHSSNVRDQGVLSKITMEASIDYGNRDQVHMDNANLMELYNTSLENELRQDAYDDYSTNLRSDRTISDIRIKVTQDNIDDYNERAEVRKEVEKAHIYADDEQKAMSSDRYSVQLGNKVEVDNVLAAVQEKNVIDATIPKDNNQELVGIRNDVVDRERIQGKTEMEHAYATDAEITDVKRRVQSDEQNLDDNRLASNEVLKQSKIELDDAQREAYSGEKEKYVQNKAVISEQVKENGAIAKAEKEAHDQKVAYVNAMDKKALTQTQDGLEGDEDERQRAKKEIDRVYSGVASQTTEEVEKIKANSVALDDVNKTIQSQEVANKQGQTEKHYANREAISKIDNKPEEKPKVANSLGEEYPEGVSQESFTQNDQNGLMTAVITRRVVVIEGHADVYTRTQSLNGVTYTKNGVPIVEHVWSRETQDPKLERHY